MVFHFTLSTGGQIAISMFVFAVFNLIAGLVDCFSPAKGNKPANYLFRFAAGGCIGTFIGIHFITKASEEQTAIVIDVISGLWAATMFLWIFRVDGKRKNVILAIMSGLLLSKATCYDLFWGIYHSFLTVIFSFVCIAACLFAVKAVSKKGQFAINFLNGVLAISSCSAFILKSDIKGILLALLMAFTSLTFQSNVLKNEDAKRILDSFTDKENVKKIGSMMKKVKDLV